MHLAPLDQSLSCRQSYRQERPLVPSQRAHLLGASLLAHHQLLLRARHAHHRVCRVQPRRCPSVLSFKTRFCGQSVGRAWLGTLLVAVSTPLDERELCRYADTSPHFTSELISSLFTFLRDGLCLSQFSFTAVQAPTHSCRGYASPLRLLAASLFSASPAAPRRSIFILSASLR